MSKARQQANLSSDGNLFADISNDRVGVGSVVPTHKLHVNGTSKFDDDVKFEGTTAQKFISWDKSADALKVSDDGKITFGDSTDLSIYHTTSGTSWIRHANTSEYFVIEGQQIDIRDYTTSKYRARFGTNVELRYDNTPRFETTNTGAKVTGNLEVTGVLTYDDVTSIDSIGIVTARAGVKVTGGNVELAQGAGTAYYQITQTNGNTVKFGIVSGSDIELSGSSNNSMYFKTNNTERLRITGGGAVGINTTVPSTSQDLTINGASNYKAGIFYKQAGVNQYRFMCEGGTGHVYYDTFVDGGDHVFRTNAASTGGTEHLRITEEGNVGINNTNPTVKLSVDGGTTNDATVVQIKNDSTSAYATNDGGLNTALSLFSDGTNAAQGVGIQFYCQKSGETGCISEIGATRESNGNSNLVFRTRDSSTGVNERLRITSAGKIVMMSQGATVSDGYAALEIRQNTGGKHLVLGTNSATSSTNEVMLGFKLHPSGQDERVKAAIICRGTGSSDYGQPSRMSFCLDGTATNDNASIAGAGHERLSINVTGQHQGHVDVKGSPAHLRLYSVRDTSDWDSTDPIGKLDFYVGADTTNNLPYNAGFIHCLNETDNVGEPSGALVFGTTTANLSGGAVERFRITSTGVVLVKGTSVIGSGTGLEVTYDGSSVHGRVLAQGFTARDNYGAATNAGNSMYSPSANTLAFSTNSTERLSISSTGNCQIQNGGRITILSANNNGQTTTLLKIGSQGNGTETRAIDMDGNWSTNESKSITYSHGSGASDMIAQMNVQYYNPGSQFNWGKLYHGANSSAYTMALKSSSASAATLQVTDKIIVGDPSDTQDYSYATAIFRHKSARSATAGNTGWPYWLPTDNNRTQHALIHVTAGGNGGTATGGTGPIATMVFGEYYDSGALITVRGGGSASPSDQGQGHGKDLMLAASNSDNTNGRHGGRLFLQSGSGYSGGAFHKNHGETWINQFGGDIHIGGCNNEEQKVVQHAYPNLHSSTATVVNEQNGEQWEAKYVTQQGMSNSNDQAWYKYEFHGGYASRAHNLDLWVTWTTGHAAPSGCGRWHIGVWEPHGGHFGINCKRQYFMDFNAGGTYYSWGIDPSVYLYRGTAPSGGGTGSGENYNRLYFAVRGRIGSNPNYGGGLRHCISCTVHENNYRGNPAQPGSGVTRVRNKFEYIGETNPSDLGTYYGWDNLP